MKIGEIEARPGEKAFGFLAGAETHGRFAVQVPVHVVAGAQPGPQLVVQAGLSGLEIEPAMVLPQVVAELDAGQMCGTLALVPLLNMSGFEFEQRNAIWDDQDLGKLGRGRADGTVSEQMLARYWEVVVAGADALIEVRTGALWGYFRYAGVYAEGAQGKSQALAQALGLPQVLLGQPADGSLAYEAARAGKAVVSAWIGGGPGLRDYREADLGRVRRAVLNGLRHLGMLGGEADAGEGPAQVLAGHTFLKPSGERGLTFMDKGKRGQQVAAGEQIGYVQHPYTGDLLQEIRAPRAGVMLHAGASWPILPEDATLAILGDPVNQ